LNDRMRTLAPSPSAVAVPAEDSYIIGEAFPDELMKQTSPIAGVVWVLRITSDLGTIVVHMVKREECKLCLSAAGTFATVGGEDLVTELPIVPSMRGAAFLRVVFKPGTHAHYYNELRQ
jgi:hypothetical protein